MKSENRPKVTYEGKTYDTYQCSQMQRRLERTVRKQKRRKVAFEAAGLTEEAQATNIRLRRLSKEYSEFSKAAGLPEQRERMKVSYVDDASTKKAAELKILRDAEAPIREAIRRGDYPLTINPEKQARHMMGTALPGRSVITISQDELQRIINKQAGSGHIELTRGLECRSKEIIDTGKEIGYTVNKKGDIIPAKSITIHYSKTGVHAVPNSRRRTK